MPVFHNLPQPPPRVVRIPWRRALSAVVATILVAVAAVAVLRRDGDAAPVSRVTAATVRTATIERTDLSTTVNLPGQLGFGTEKPLRGDGDGAVTWLPRAGRTIGRGDTAFRVDDRPVILFYGRTPLFRRLAEPGTIGRDVRVVADNLSALGYQVGSQPTVGTSVRVPSNPDLAAATPSVRESGGAGPSASSEAGSMTSGAGSAKSDPKPAGSATGSLESGTGEGRSAAPVVTVRPGDAVLTPALRVAIRRWQRDVGAVPTGVIEVGQVVVQPGRIRVAATTAQLGDPADGSLMSITGTAKKVTLQAQPAEIESVRHARRVTVTLPDGKTAAARISDISRVVTSGGEGDGSGDQAKVTASVTLRKPSLIENLDAAPVQVEFVSQARASVLAVPVGALLALSGGGYAVQVSGGGLIPVTTGLFTQGQVEIKGDGVVEGTTVVTTS